MQIVAYITGLVVGAIALALLFRRLHVPGSAVLAGAMVGFLLGPTFMGRIAPDWFEGDVIGGQAERESLDALRGEHEARELAQQKAGIASTPDAGEAEERDYIASMERLQETLRIAQWNDREPVRWSAIISAGLFLFTAGLARSTIAGPRPHLYQALSIGIWSALLPGALLLVALRWLDVDIAAAFIASSAIAAGAVIFARGDLDAADEAEVGGARLIVTASRIAFIIAILTIITAAALGVSRSNIVMIAIPPLAYLIALVLPRTSHTCVVHARDYVFLPCITALLAIRIEFFEHLSLWMIVAAMILSGDGRWFGAYLGAMLSGVRRSLRTMRLVLGVMSAGTTQIALATIFLHAGLFSEEVAYALLAGAIIMEITTNARRKMARQIAETEEEFGVADERENT